MSAKTCLVTGGAGFIGSHLAEKLAALGHKVTAVDHLRYGSYCPKPGSGVTFLPLDVTDAREVNKLVSRHEIVFHLAAVLGVRTTVTKPVDMIENNILGTLNILRAAHCHGSKVVFASSSEVYGKAKPPFAERGDRLYGGGDKLRWSYALEKSLEEALCLGYGMKGLPVTVLRYFNIYGPRAKEGRYGGVIPRFIRAALAGQDIPVYGDGKQTRCFTYIDDAVEATVRAMAQKTNQEIINIGSTEEISIGELACRVKRLTGTSSRIVYLPFEQVYPPGFEEIPNRYPDLGKARCLLGYNPQTCLEEGLKQTIAWHRCAASSNGGDCREWGNG